mmetsp:Transcript_9843/g.17712  ORF Transcript_9843/g.17712 Transcript_9843/m.17712 type:complete len:219 (+) Transcript_9843:436-1092(+)
MFENLGSLEPNMSSRVLDLMPSAPITRSNSSLVPSAKETCTPLAVFVSCDNCFPKTMVSVGSSAASSCCRSDLMTVKAINSPLYLKASGPPKVLTAFAMLMSSKGLPPTARAFRASRGFAMPFSCSPRPSLDKTTAPPLMLKPAPRAGRSSSCLSNTFTVSTPVSRRKIDSAAESPAGPEPMTATRFGRAASHVTLPLARWSGLRHSGREKGKEIRAY